MKLAHLKIIWQFHAHPVKKIIVHNGDNYTSKFYNMIYLDVNNKVNIKKNKVK
jgi:hypothetical protein